jgi:hypothetical protein
MEFSVADKLSFSLPPSLPSPSLLPTLTRRGRDEIVQARAHTEPRLGQTPAARRHRASGHPAHLSVTLLCHTQTSKAPL